MTRRRLGTRVRSISIAAGLVAAMALSGTALAERPAPSATVTLGFVGCAATVDVNWAAVPGQAKTFEVRLENNVNGTSYDFGTGTAHRSGTSTGHGTLVAETTKTFYARLRFYDRSGVVLIGFQSSPVDAACV